MASTDLLDGLGVPGSLGSLGFLGFLGFRDGLGILGWLGIAPPGGSFSTWRLVRMAVQHLAARTHGGSALGGSYA
ncbi:hypothetical protein H1V43_09775 [Streptomyces sp. PSKA54]|uniref:Uncharacterized protein n=1 Tax=Streptomyces himalayensis subsp. aureolus TaxID=2758039 RepID=A0A7W2CZ75_9ACTN|nr:hypothetical protein [Streptomyces himalayensis]MBA4861667.1 hypothetical protein [Streptomyces himalayensis subsp. aureolus]